MAGVEVLAFLHLGDLQNVFQDVINHQAKEIIKHHLTTLLIAIMKLQKAVEKDLFIARHPLPSSSVMNQVSFSPTVHAQRVSQSVQT